MKAEISRGHPKERVWLDYPYVFPPMKEYPVGGNGAEGTTPGACRQPGAWASLRLWGKGSAQRVGGAASGPKGGQQGGARVDGRGREKEDRASTWLHRDAIQGPGGQQAPELLPASPLPARLTW